MDTSKQLKQHLQHHQEPFSLQCYLIERSYMFNNLSSDNSSNIHHLYSPKNLKPSIKYELHKIKKRLLHATGILRSLTYKFIPAEDNQQQFSNWDDEEHNTDIYYVHEYLTAHTQATQQADSLKTLAVSGNYTNNDVQDKVLPANMFQTLTLPKLRRSEVDTGRVCDLKISEGQETHVSILSQKLVRDYVRKLLVNSNILKFRSSRKYRRRLPKRKQLRFDSVEKNKGFHKSEGKAVSESKDFENMIHIHEHFNLLEKQCRQVKKISQVLYAQEWKSFQIVNWEIHMEIGDSITDDIVSEIIDFFI